MASSESRIVTNTTFSILFVVAIIIVSRNQLCDIPCIGIQTSMINTQTSQNAHDIMTIILKVRATKYKQNQTKRGEKGNSKVLVENF